MKEDVSFGKTPTGTRGSSFCRASSFKIHVLRMKICEISDASRLCSARKITSQNLQLATFDILVVPSVPRYLGSTAISWLSNLKKSLTYGFRENTFFSFKTWFEKGTSFKTGLICLVGTGPGTYIKMARASGIETFLKGTMNGGERMKSFFKI